MMPVTQWKEPAPVWNGTVPEEGRPGILEIRSDQFLPQFLESMARPEPAEYFEDHHLAPADAGTPMKLFLPLHGSFYLITASLVCRQLGLPDKQVDREEGESVFFVIRRLGANGEDAWIETEGGGFWQTLTGDARFTIAAGEERLPLHPVSLLSKPATARSVFTDGIQRELHYGYIPTGNQAKYRETQNRVIPTDTPPQTVVNDFIADAEANVPPGEVYNFRADQFMRRVFLPWQSLLRALTTAAVPVVEIATTAQEQQLYMIVELGDFLKNYLPTLWTAMKSGDGGALAGDMADLFELLTADVTLFDAGNEPFLSEVLLAHESHFDLVRGVGEIPATNFDLGQLTSTVVSPGANALATLDLLDSHVRAAIPEENTTLALPPAERDQLAHLITHQVRPLPTADPLYHIRVAYEYDPECPSLVGVMPSHDFHLAKVFDPEAPARLVKLEAPSIRPQDLRRYARGVGIEMGPELHKLASSMTGDDLEGVLESVEGGGGIGIMMICTFSIQIIFLVAFIVMFSFLIALNFIFGWLAYLRICLPIPVKE